jgi:hypothetical protein
MHYQTTLVPLLPQRLRAIHAPSLRRCIAVTATLLRRRLATTFVWVGYFSTCALKFIYKSKKKKN